MSEKRETLFWRRSTTSWPVWHLMKGDTGRAVCGREPKGAWKVNAVDLIPWPENSCMSCADVRWGNFPPKKDGAWDKWIDSVERFVEDEG